MTISSQLIYSQHSQKVLQGEARKSLLIGAVQTHPQASVSSRCAENIGKIKLSTYITALCTGLPSLFSTYFGMSAPGCRFGVGKLHCMNNDKYPQFTVRLSDKSLQQLEKLALIRSRSRSEIVREAIHYYSKLYYVTIIDSSEPKN